MRKLFYKNPNNIQTHIYIWWTNGLFFKKNKKWNENNNKGFISFRCRNECVVYINAVDLIPKEEQPHIDKTFWVLKTKPYTYMATYRKHFYFFVCVWKK